MEEQRKKDFEYALDREAQLIQAAKYERCVTSCKFIDVTVQRAVC